MRKLAILMCLPNPGPLLVDLFGLWGSGKSREIEPDDRVGRVQTSERLASNEPLGV